MPSIADIVNEINCLLPGVKYGIARTLVRENDLLPVINGKYVGIDGVNEFQLYHKVNGISFSRATNSGYGNDQYETEVYAMSIIVFSRHDPENMALMIRSKVPQKMRFDATVRVNINPVRALLNSQQVCQQEYGTGGEFKLSEGQYLFQFDYNVEVVYKKGCFDSCPQDFLKCKN